MLFNLIPPQYQIAAKLVALFIFVSSLLGSGYHWGYRSADNKAKLASSKADATALSEWKKVNDENIKLQETMHKETQNADIQYNTALAEINKLRSAKPVTIVKRMYDNSARKDCPKRVPEGIDPSTLADASDTGGVELSEEAGRFLQEEALRADLIVRECNLFKKSAHDWAISAQGH